MNRRVHENLEAVLPWLKQVFPQGSHLKLCWQPEGCPEDPSLLGEWKDDTIYVYVGTDEETAVLTLIHEYMHFILNNVDRPWAIICENLLMIIQRLTYEISEESLDNVARGLKNLYQLQKRRMRRNPKPDNGLRDMARLALAIWYLRREVHAEMG